MNHRNSGHGQTSLITGASSGIGYEFAKVFAQNGYDLVLVARREEKLRQLADELEKQHSSVSVTVLCPGPTKSGFQQRADMEDSKLVNNKEIMDAATVARAGYQALMDGKTVVIPGLVNNLQTLAPRFFPRDMVAQMVRNAEASVHEN